MRDDGALCADLLWAGRLRTHRYDLSSGLLFRIPSTLKFDQFMEDTVDPVLSLVGDEAEGPELLSQPRPRCHDERRSHVDVRR